MPIKNILEENDVATTALLINYWKNKARQKTNWPLLTQQQGTREKDLFKDSIMPLFINEQVENDAKLRLDERMWLPTATRGRFFRRTVSDGVKHKGVKQIILLGSGFDTLAARKEKYTKQFGANFFEIDQDKILKCKAQIYLENNIAQNATYIGMDYVKDNLMEALAQNDIDFTKPTLILWEGNTFYLEKEDVLRILRDLSSRFQKLIITFDYMHKQMQTNQKQLDTQANDHCLEKTLGEFASKKSPFKTFFEPQEMGTICEELGIKCVNHKTAAELAQEYKVDETPYYTAGIYSMVTFER